MLSKQQRLLWLFGYVRLSAQGDWFELECPDPSADSSTKGPDLGLGRRIMWPIILAIHSSVATSTDSCAPVAPWLKASSLQNVPKKNPRDFVDYVGLCYPDLAAMVHNITLVLPSLLMRRLPPGSLRMDTFLPEANSHAFNQLFWVPVDRQCFMTPITWPPQIPPQSLFPGDTAGDFHPLPTRLQPVIGAENQLPQLEMGEHVTGLGQWPVQQQLGYASEDSLLLPQETAVGEAVSTLDHFRPRVHDPMNGMVTDWATEPPQRSSCSVWTPNAGNDDVHSVLSLRYSDYVYDSPNSANVFYNIKSDLPPPIIYE